MHTAVDGRAPRLRLVLIAMTLGLLLVGSAFAILAAAPPPRSAGPVRAMVTLPVTFSYSPSTVSVNSQTTISYSITGGTPPFTISVNGAPNGCQPQTNPFTTNNATDMFTCHPAVTGTFPTTVNVNDNAGNSGSASATLTVNSQSGGSGTGGNGSGPGGFSLPQDLVNMVFLIVLLFLVALFAMAAGIIAMAVLVSRRLKQVAKALTPPVAAASKAPSPPSPPKPPEDEL